MIRIFPVFSLAATLVAVCLIPLDARGEAPADDAGSGANKHGAANFSAGREHYLVARKLAGVRFYERALTEVEAAISENPKKPSFYNLQGYCLQSMQRYDEAIGAFNHTLFLDPKNAYAQRHLIQCRAAHKLTPLPSRNDSSFELSSGHTEGSGWLGLNNKQVAEDNSPRLKPFSMAYASGMKAYRADNFEDAARDLGKAVGLLPGDFAANFWRGMALVRLGKYVEAIPNFEVAHEIKNGDNAVKLELLACYLLTQQVEKAFGVYPIVIGIIGSGLLLFYFLGFLVLLLFSVPIKAAAFPGLRFSGAWTAVYWEGQIAFFFLVMFLLHLGMHESALVGMSIAGLPIVIVAATAFARQPWGNPFRWPFRIGTWKIIGTAVLWLVLLQLGVIACAVIYMEASHKSVPPQNVVPIIRGALKSNPLIAWSAVVVVIPVVEEVLFRGLLYGAFEKRWGVKGAIWGSSFLFAVFHLQLFGFLALFAIGAIFAWARSRTNSLGLPILLHGLNNAAATVMIAHWRV